MTLKTLFPAALYAPQPVPSWWEASAPPDQSGYEPFEGEAEVEVAVIGGGFAGLSTAYHLAKDHGIEARVLEAGHIGWGASGRNGGFCCFAPDKVGIAGLIERYGLEETKRYYASQVAAIDLVSHLGEAEAIDYDRQGEGFYEVAHAPKVVSELSETQEVFSRHFGIESEVLSAEAFGTVGHRGTEQFGALHVKAGFGLHPLKFLSGLAAAAARHGARLHGHSLVTSWEKEGEWHRLRTARGSLRAKRVVLATNGFLREGLKREFDGRVLPALSNIVVTRPLTREEQAAENFVTETPLCNLRHLLFYYRLLPDRRVLFGARGDSSGSEAAAEAMRVWLTRRLGEVFPTFREVEITHFWRGLVSLTRDLTPAIGRLPEDDSVFFALGCHGNGVNTMPWAGQQIALLIRGANRDEDILPAVLRGPAPKFPLPGLRKLYLRAAYAYYAWKDR
ncbi:MAG: FAD-dependent oxidoreductase [Rhodospirillales bacterium]